MLEVHKCFFKKQ